VYGGGIRRMTVPLVTRAHLRVGGLTPLTTIDYPGELAAVVFCQGCPWRCRYCHNAHLLPRDGHLIPWGDLSALLERRRGLLDAVVFSGGEPTLQNGLGAAMAEVRAMGFKVGLHTAGCFPRRLLRLLAHVDWVGLDIKALPEGYPAITAVPDSGRQAWRSLDMLLRSDVRFEVRTTVMPGWTLEDQVQPLMKGLARAGVRDFALQGCRTDSTLDPALAGASPLSAAPPFAAHGDHLFERFTTRAW